MADNTTLNQGTGGDAIATEDIGDNSGVGTAPSNGERQIDGLPQTEYKMPRSKIAVGSYGTDAGDAAPGNALAVQMHHERHMMEDALIDAADQGNFALTAGRHGTRVQMCDRRGGSGQRGLR